MEPEREHVDALRAAKVDASQKAQRRTHVATDRASKDLKVLRVASWGCAIAEALSSRDNAHQTESSDEYQRRTIDLHGCSKPVGLMTSSDLQARRRRQQREAEMMRQNEIMDRQDLENAIVFQTGGKVESYGQAA